MIKGVFVPTGNPSGSQVLPFEADIVVSGIPHAPGCSDGVNPGNFSADKGMQESLKKAKQACQRRLAHPFSVWEAILLPILVKPLFWPWLLLAIVSFLACVIFSAGCLVWSFAPVSPPTLLLPGWQPFFFFSVLFWVTIFSLPQQLWPGLRSSMTSRSKQDGLQGFHNRRIKWFKQLNLHWRNSKGLEDYLRDSCFIPYIGDRSSSHKHFFGPSAGLTFFCAFVEAVARTGQQGICLPWQKCLIDEMDHWVASVALGPHEEFEPLGTAPEFQDKLRAIWQYNHHHPENPLTLAIFSRGDFSSVDTGWSTITGEKLVFRSGSKQGYIMAECPRTRLKFLFCRHLDNFIHFLYPWNWPWLVFRVSTIIAILTLFFFIKPPTPPEFTFECVPSSSFSRPGIYSVALLPGQKASCHIRIIAPGCPGLLNLNVESNYSGTLSPTLNGEWHKQFSLTMRQNSVLFFFTMPPEPSPSEVIAVITLRNGAGKYDQETIFFAHRQASP